MHASAQVSRPVEVRLRRADIEALSLGQVSTMPQGLDTPLSPAEMSDLLAYLQSLRSE